jgi:tetratricopeptide (TPR) repeat protein
MIHEQSTIALNMIVKDEYDRIMNIILLAGGYFDEINLTVSDKLTADKLSIETQKYPKVKVVHRPWNNRFDEARNENFAMSTCDYNFWLDSDDTFDFSSIPKLVEIADNGNYDQLLLPYNYAQDDQGNTIAFHWRERLMRRSHPFIWKGWVHETPITDIPFSAHKVNAPVIHQPASDHVHESIDRNHKILVEAVAKTDDPRYMMYLGTSHHARGEYGEALQMLDKFTKVSGSAEDIYRAISCMSECAYLMKRSDSAINYALQAAALIPEYPMAYWLLAQWEADQENWREALEWVKVSETKPDPNTLSVIDPTARDRARLIAAQSEFMLKNHNNALKWLRKVSPENEARQDLEESFINEADAETFITLLPKFRKYFANDDSLYNSLCYDLKYDTRLRALREAVTEPREWGKNSIVILCGESFEEWGPHTLDKGMGGSEEAIIYLSRELAKQGWAVTVYGAVDEPVFDCITEVESEIGVYYLPWKELNRQDNFNVFVAWRAPEFTEHVDAKVKLADIHDVLGQDRMKPYGDVTYMVKSQYHRDLYPHVKDIRVVGNGIVKAQFND